MFNKLLSWSEENFSDLPWRKGRNLYTTLVSEIMLQQTTVGTVLSHYHRFLRIYPNIETLANASEEEVCLNWQGLGYYRRARNLRHAAIQIKNEFNGEIPLGYEDLIKIKGIGEYTANALRSIGFNKRSLSVDANLERVLARIYGFKEKKGKELQDRIRKSFKAGEIIKDVLRWRDLNESLMDLGRTKCQARKVDCPSCPMSSHCVAFKEEKALDYPFGQEKKIKKLYNLNLIRIIVRKDDQFVVYQKNKKQWLSGQYELPTFVISSEDEKLKQYPLFNEDLNIKNLVSFKTSITKYKITNYVLEMDYISFSSIFNKGEWSYVNLDTSKYHFSSASLKTIDLIA